MSRLSGSTYIDECYRVRKRDYHEKLRLYHPDKNVNKSEAEKKIADKYNECQGVMDNVNTAYEYFNQEGFSGAFSGITHY